MQTNHSNLLNRVVLINFLWISFENGMHAPPTVQEKLLRALPYTKIETIDRAESLDIMRIYRNTGSIQNGIQHSANKIGEAIWCTVGTITQEKDG
jgi:predicted CoA-binding protein